MSKAKRDHPRFDVAFSFSGENRNKVRDIAEELAKTLGRERIFYDQWYVAEFARPNTDVYLQQMYHNSRLIVVCLGKAHEETWVQFEWDAIRSLIIRRKQEAASGLGLLPIRFGGESVPSVFANIMTTDARDLSVDQIVALIIERLKVLKEEGDGGTSPRDSKTKKAITDPSDGKPDIFISYSWKHDAEVPMVDDLCTALEDLNLNIIRDKTNIETGDRISQFMERLGNGGCVVVVLSDPYLKSQYCMYELYRIYVTANHDDQRFLDRVIPLIHPGINISRPIERIQFAAFWKRERDELDAAAREYGPDVMGHEDHKALRRMSEFALFVSDMLAYLNDKCIPRDIESVQADNFRLVREQVRRAVDR